MGLLDDTARDVATLPRDAVAMQSPHWRIVRRVQQRLATEARERQVRMISFDRVGENSRPIEKEWLKTELTRTQQLCDAYRVFDDWWRAARVDILNATLATEHGVQRKAMARLQRRIHAIGDPTAPGWKQPLGHRVAMKARAGKS